MSDQKYNYRPAEAQKARCSDCGYFSRMEHPHNEDVVFYNCRKQTSEGSAHPVHPDYVCDQFTPERT